MKYRRGLAALLAALLLTTPAGASFLREDAPAAAAAEVKPTIYGYREGLAQATANGLWGFANVAGEIVVPIQYDSVTDFALGVARVERNGKLGVIRQDGGELIPAEYDTLTNIGYGLYLAQQGDLWGVVSLLPFAGKEGAMTHELYPMTYTAARVELQGGREVLILTAPEGGVEIPLSEFPRIMMEKGIPSAQFPLLKGVLPEFDDVGPRDWFAVWADIAYNLGLMEGTGENHFAPRQILTVAEVVKLAAYLESQAIEDDFHLQPVTARPWYSSSVAYCIATGIIGSGEFSDYERPVTRSEMVKILSATTLARRLTLLNDPVWVRENIPDVTGGAYAADAIFDFYAKGLVQGTDGAMTFHPEGQLTRAEAAAIVSRMARAEQRIRLSREERVESDEAVLNNTER